MKTTHRATRIIVWLLIVAIGFYPFGAYAQTIHFHNDIAGSPLAATNEDGSLAWKQSYRPYGERMLTTPDNNKLWFHGKEADNDTGLSYFGARSYDPVLGRFLGMDPQGFDDKNLHTFNRYAYGNNNPYKYRDPSGKGPELAFLFIAVVGVAALTAIGGYQAAKPPSALDGYPGTSDSGATILTTPGIPVSGNQLPGFSRLVEELGNLIFKDSAKPAEGTAAEERAKNIAKGIPESQLGPSGKPKLHVVEHPSRKEAKDAARAEVGQGGTTVNHPSPSVGQPHFHGVTQEGEHSRIHHEYPQ